MCGRIITENKYFIFDRPRKRDIKTLYWTLRNYARVVKYRTALHFGCKEVSRSSNQKKYDVCICAIFKDEGEFLKEWIEYHIIVGIDHFFLYNNNSSDDYLEILKPYINRNIVTLVEWPKQHAQIEAYRDAIVNYSGTTRWMGFIDLDEFVVPVKNSSVYDFLKQYEKKAASILIYWKVFGSSGLQRREPDCLVTEQFTKSFPKWDDVGKCFYNTNFEFKDDINGVNSVLHHYFWCVHKGNLIPPVNAQNHISFSGHNILRKMDLPIQINHYLTKSYEDYYNKTTNKTDVYFKENPRKMDYFYKINKYCTGQDFKIFKYIDILKSSMKENQ